MKISTAFFGPQEIDRNTIITFQRPIPGFEESQRYKLFHSENDEDLQYLQSVDDAEVCFSVMEPAHFGYEYEMILSEDDLALLQTNDPADLMIMLMVYTIDEKDQQKAADIPINTNWRSPIIINLNKKIGMQKTLSKISKVIKISGE